MELDSLVKNIESLTGYFFWTSFYVSCGIAMLAGTNYLKRKSEEKKNAVQNFREAGLDLLSKNRSIRDFPYKTAPKLDQQDLFEYNSPAGKEEKTRIL